MIIAYALLSIEETAINDFFALIPLSMTSDCSATEAAKVHPSLLLLLMHHDLNIANFHAPPAT